MIFRKLGGGGPKGAWNFSKNSSVLEVPPVSKGCCQILLCIFFRNGRGYPLILQKIFGKTIFRAGGGAGYALNSAIRTSIFGTQTLFLALFIYF